MPEKIVAPDKGATFVPLETYEIRVIIGSGLTALDYTSDLILARLTSSLSTGYQIMDLVFEIDPNDIIANELYGQDEIKLSITLMRETGIIGPRIDLELMMIQSDFQLNEKATESTGKQKDRGLLAVRTVVRPAFKVLNTLVNEVFIGSTLGTIISSLASDAGAALKFDLDGQNTTVIDQVCIPPMTFYKAIKEHDRANPEFFDGYLDQRFGLFDGVPGVFCQYDKTVYIKNLTRNMMYKSPKITIYQMSIDASKEKVDEVIQKSTDGNTFYTYSLIDTDYGANAKFAVLGSNIKHIVKPKDTLSYTITQNLEDVAKTYGLIHQNKLIKRDIATYRTKYYNEDTGYEKESTIFNSRFGRQMADLSTISIQLERNLPLANLLQVGEPVNYKPMTVEYQDLGGKYILWSSVIEFTRPNIWQSVATLNLVRTNKTIGQNIKPKFRAR